MDEIKDRIVGLAKAWRETNKSQWRRHGKPVCGWQKEMLEALQELDEYEKL